MSYSIYLISTEYFGKKVYKIGRTKRNINQRLNELRTSNANPLEVLYLFETKWGTQVETRLHSHFRDKRMEGEWFALTSVDIDNFLNLCQEYNDTYQMLFETNPFYQKEIRKKTKKNNI